MNDCLIVGVIFEWYWFWVYCTSAPSQVTACVVAGVTLTDMLKSRLADEIADTSGPTPSRPFRAHTAYQKVPFSI